MLISEIYLSRQGEGLLTGTPSVFVRTSGCNLRCDFCDTPFTSWNPEGSQLDVTSIVERVMSAAAGQLPDREGAADLFEPSAKHVVLTGGEPMLARGVVDLCDQLSGLGFHITIETAGTLDTELKCDLMSISPKLANSTPTAERAGRWAEKHERARYQPQVVTSLIERHDYQLKFVVSAESDIEEIESLLAEVGSIDRSKVLLMPEGVDSETLEQRAQWLGPLCERTGFRLCARLHIQWYGNKRAT